MSNGRARQLEKVPYSSDIVLSLERERERTSEREKERVIERERERTNECV